MVTWKNLISQVMDHFNESFDDVESCTLNDEELNIEFNDGYGVEKGKQFTIWTKNRVYFPVCYRGS